MNPSATTAEPPGAGEPDPGHGRGPAVLSAAELRALPPTVDVETAARILGIGRALAYRLVRQDEFPCRVLRMGKRYLIPRHDLLAALGVTTEPASPAGETNSPVPATPAGPQGAPAGARAAL